MMTSWHYQYVNGCAERFEGSGNLLLVHRDHLVTVLLLGRNVAVRFTHPWMFLEVCVRGGGEEKRERERRERERVRFRRSQRGD